MLLTVLPAENPLLPAAYDGVWSAFIGLVSVLMLGALFDVMRTATFLRAVEWVVLIVLVPIAGPAIWFAYGRRRFLD
jgi:hypothetical protein